MKKAMRLLVLSSTLALLASPVFADGSAASSSGPGTGNPPPPTGTSTTTTSTTTTSTTGLGTIVSEIISIAGVVGL